MSSATKDIIAAMEFAAEQGLGHFARQDGKTRLCLWREPGGPAVAGGRLGAQDPGAAEVVADLAAVIVPSPLSGLCHLSAEPDGPAFVTLGLRVEVGQTICLIEAMKVMTAVPASHGGIVSKIHVLNGAAVQAEAPLIEVRP